ncbi:pheST operon leader peptide PheM [Cronobacter dublinensis]|nr:pheST operon leader peptide PheM [Cronobacter dublinensis]MDI7491865.1 pheST operon leader peptide PheM [Cronobacter dublinensis]
MNAAIFRFFFYFCA